MVFGDRLWSRWGLLGLVLPCIVHMAFSTLVVAQDTRTAFMGRDKACGPRCLVALLAATSGTDKDRTDVAAVYRLIGRKLNEPVSLLDLKLAAQKLGFVAEGHRWTMADLATMEGYAIVAVGNAAGTQQEPLHFFLVTGVVDDGIVTIDDKSLERLVVSKKDFELQWPGYALSITSTDKNRPITRQDNAAAAKLPDRQFDEVTDVGVVDYGAKVQRAFVIHRSSDPACDIDVAKKSCSCLESKIGKNEAGDTTLTLSMHVLEAGQQQSHVMVRLKSRNGQESYRSYAIKAFVRNSAKLIPEKAYIAQGDASKYDIAVEWFGTGDAPAQFRDAKSSIPGLEVKLSSTSQIDVREGVHRQVFEYVADASKVAKHESDVHGKIVFVLKTSGGEREFPMEVVLAGTISRYSYFPKSLMFAGRPDSKDPITKNVRVSFVDKAALPQACKVVTNDGLPVLVHLSTDGNYLDIGVSVQAAVFKTLVGSIQKGFVIVSAESDDVLVKIPITLLASN